MEQRSTPITQLMTVGVLTVPEDALVADAAAALLEEEVGSLVVVDGDDRPTGMFTTTDLADFVAARSGDDARVAEYMTEEVVTVGTQQSLREAAAKMMRHGIHHLPVTDEEGDVVGMLSTMDLTAHYSYTGGSDMV
ncbi:CBS domain-containing protein [Halobium salinum]|uniref:CBS domain-containing protein n=1 Tax=Halobium salinum TaxID=1364940 RepID=A0ABD5PBQ7_9EURY|nr:CBS domain-containing protein [Halobium salinum]